MFPAELSLLDIPFREVTLSGLLLPSTEPKRDSLAGVPQLVGINAIFHGARNDHAAYAERGDRLSRCCRIVAAITYVALEEADHRSEDSLEGLFDLLASPRYVAWKREHRTGILNALEVLP